MAKNVLEQLQQIEWEIIHGDILRLFQEEYFAFDLLRTLYEDTVEIKKKLQILSVLQEYGGIGLEPSSVDQIISPLLDIFKQNYVGDSESLFSAQLLTTATSLLVEFDLMVPSNLCLSLVDLLMKLVGMVNDGTNKRLRGLACCCLTELEAFSPGLLKKHLHSLLIFAQLEKTYVHQDLLILLAKVIDNALKKQVSDSSKTNEITKVSDQSPTEDELSLQEIRQFVSMVMDNYALFTPPGLWNLLSTIITAVKSDSGTSPSVAAAIIQFKQLSHNNAHFLQKTKLRMTNITFILQVFKSFILQHIPTSDLSLFHLILYIKSQFPRNLLSSSEESLLLKRLIVASTYKSFGIQQQQLMLQWLVSFLQEQMTTPKPSANRISIIQKFSRNLYPSVFDDASIHLCKVPIVSFYFDVFAHKESLGQVLLGSLSLLQKLAQSSDCNQTTVTYYRALFYFYRQHHNTSLTREIQTVLLQMVRQFPKFVPPTICFLNCVKELTPDSSLYLDVLLELQTLVVTAPLEEALKNHGRYLQILKKTAIEEGINPEPVLKFLHALVQRMSSHGADLWSLGSIVLAVCRNFLLHHDTHSIFSELGSLLKFLMTSYTDVDVHDRARFYYALLTGAADSKIREILRSSDYKIRKHNLSSLIHIPGLQTHPATMTILDKPYLIWERINMKPVWKPLESLNNCSTLSDTEAGIVKEYTKCVAKGNQSSLQSRFQLSMAPTCCFDVLQAISIHIEMDDNYLKMEDTYVAYMTKTDFKEFEVTFQPKKPLPGIFPTRSVFATEDKQTFTCSLSNTRVEFHNLILPLPWECFGEVDRKAIFSALWQHVTGNKQHGIESVKVLPFGKNNLEKIVNSSLSIYKTTDFNGTVCCAMFLLPRYHLLLRFDCITSHTVVAIATDNWEILPHVQKYLEALHEE